MEYPQMERAARRLLIDQGLSSEGAAQTVKTVIENPEKCEDEGGVPLSLADCAAFEKWAATLSDDQLDVACCGCDETPANGPITYTSGEDRDLEKCAIVVVIPSDCQRAMQALFDNLYWEGM